ncbi:hypothetical protein [Rhizobium sp.]|uniref:hypothetical protein n=1 Tax=Rhizobium sp. TaxID=391 RepID=UPI00289CCB9B
MIFVFALHIDELILPGLVDRQVGKVFYREFGQALFSPAPGKTVLAFSAFHPYFAVGYH